MRPATPHGHARSLAGCSLARLVWRCWESWKAPRVPLADTLALSARGPSGPQRDAIEREREREQRSIEQTSMELRWRRVVEICEVDLHMLVKGFSLGGRRRRPRNTHNYRPGRVVYKFFACRGMFAEIGHNPVAVAQSVPNAARIWPRFG